MESLLAVMVCGSKMNVKNFEPCSHNALEHLKPLAVSPGEQYSLCKESHIGKIPTLQELTGCLLSSPPARHQWTDGLCAANAPW